MVIVPTLLRALMNEGAKIPLIGCIVQLYLFAVTDIFQCFLLSVMSYDRYLAICNPLRYSSLMSHRVCVKLIVMSWLLALSLTLVTLKTVATQEFCNQNTINHFFCDYFPLLELSCSDTSLARILTNTFSLLVTIFPFILIIGSYICIAHEILKIVSSIGRQKAFSTCSSHLAVVSIFYGTLIGIYMVPTGNQSQTISKLLSLLYTVVTPFINPMIYSLKRGPIAHEHAVPISRL
ncbi:olfactory receptor 1468-like [Xenopus tropicalis]|uniref:Olfactory receptor 1468-like n=1 Tax=Xenopus tropicalis TaxID=8364 RepID=A0A8J1J8L0_XENTR|nr:olfactory receptor 1468-like [Xenopus tropicalis]